MGITHSMDDEQVKRISKALKDASKSIEGINDKFDKVEAHWRSVDAFNGRIVDTVHDTLDSFDRLDSTVTDGTDALLDYVQFATEDMTQVLDTTIGVLQSFDMRREMNNIPKTFIPLLIPLIILLIELAITNAYLGLLLSSSAGRRYSSYLLGNAGAVLFGLMISLVWFGCYRMYLSYLTRKTREREIEEEANKLEAEQAGALEVEEDDEFNLDDDVDFYSRTTSAKSAASVRGDDEGDVSPGNENQSRASSSRDRLQDFGIIDVDDFEPKSHALEAAIVAFQPGPVGLIMDWSTGVVTRVLRSGQAESSGVQAGWQFLRINQEPFCEEVLHHLIHGSAPYIVTFLKDTNAVSADGRTSPTASQRNSAADDALAFRPKRSSACSNPSAELSRGGWEYAGRHQVGSERHMRLRGQARASYTERRASGYNALDRDSRLDRLGSAGSNYGGSSYAGSSWPGGDSRREQREQMRQQMREQMLANSEMRRPQSDMGQETRRYTDSMDRRRVPTPTRTVTPNQPPAQRGGTTPQWQMGLTGIQVNWTQGRNNAGAAATAADGAQGESPAPTQNAQPPAPVEQS